MADLVENETNPVTFSCQATGESIPTITWYFNSIMINTLNANKHNISTSINGNEIISLFTIINMRSSDVGTYTCQAENIIGNDKSSRILTVHGE